MSVKLKAQSREDIVYLYNGSILKGKVIENIKGVHTSIEIVGRNIIVIPDTAIKMILMDQKIVSKDRQKLATPVEMKANVNFYGGSQNSGGFTFITSYRFPFRLATGVCSGLQQTCMQRGLMLTCMANRTWAIRPTQKTKLSLRSQMRCDHAQLPVWP